MLSDKLNLNLFYQNVRGLRTKTLQFRQNILTHNYDIILITETWLTDGFYKGELCDDRYDVFRCDRSEHTSNKKTGGGVMICSRCALHARERPEWACAGIECVWLTVPARSLGTADKRDLHICVIYIPPDSNLPTRLIAFTKMLIRIFTSCPNDHFIIAGDLNLTIVSWSSTGPILYKRGSVALQDAVVSFIDACNLSGLNQHNFHTNICNNVLDLIMSDTAIEVSRSSTALVKEDLYHPSLHLDASDLVIPCFKRQSISKLSFFKADYSSLNMHFTNTDWDTLLVGDSIDEIVEKFYSHLRKGIDEYVPIKKSPTASYPVWYSRSLIHIINDKLNAHKRWKLYNNPRDYDEFSILRARQKKIQTKCYSLFKENMQRLLKKDPKQLWSYLKSIRNNGSGYPNTLTLGCQTFKNESDACTGFNNFFESVFQKPASSYNHCLQPYAESNDSVFNLNVSKTSVLKLLNSLDVNKGPGTDGIPPVFIKRCAASILYPLHKIFMLSVNVYAAVPNIWKEARIVPVHKSGSRSRIEHYRPISILNTFSKILEKVVYSAICTTVFKSIPDEQHGFMNKRSTVTNLTYFTNYIFRSMDDGKQVDVIYTDFEKAFDRVDHIILLHKLNALGIRGDLHRWFSSYITNRRQAVVIGSARSDYVTISSGVPQGSILGPLLYNAYLFDINTSFTNSKFIMFADDKKVFLKINDTLDCVKIQNDLNNLSVYYIKNRISVNIAKCLQVTFTRKTKPINYTYYLNNVAINKVNSVRDLGVRLDSKMMLVEHIDTIVDKAYKQLGFIKRVCKSFTNIDCIKVLYFTYVRSILEYACSIWSPCYIVHINRLESLQNKFVKFLSFKDHKSFETYTEACRYFGLDSLEQRRQQYDILLLHDILSGKIDCTELLRNVSLKVPSYRTRHTPLLHVPHVSTNYAQNSVLCRAARTYNKHYSGLDLFYLSKTALKSEIKKLHRSS